MLRFRLALVLLVTALAAAASIEPLEMSFAQQPGDFNFGRYKPSDLDGFLKSHGRLSNVGIDIFNGWEPIVFDATLEAAPVKWGAETIELLRKLKAPNLPKISYGLLLRTKRNRLIMVHVQDVIAKSILKEIDEEAEENRKGPVGNYIRIWAIYVYNMAGDHGLIVNYAKTQLGKTDLSMKGLTDDRL